MPDVFTPEKRSELMSRIKGRDTKPERLVRSMLHRMGYRFRLNRTDLPGKPDIVLPRYQTVIFVNGCFWHRHKDCKFAYTPKSRTEFWIKKLEANARRDIDSENKLIEANWKVITIWECELLAPQVLENRLSTLLSEIRLQKNTDC
jgi:DNA mismatch endonuclease (patch repair protein)